MRFLLALFLIVIPACTISYNGTEGVEDVTTGSAPSEPDVADAAIPPG